jgi:hypothetical protein
MMKAFPTVKETIDSVFEKSGPSILVTTTPIKNAMVEAIRRGVKARVITDITQDNLHYCKELMAFRNEIRHLDAIKGHFAISDRKKYVGSATPQEGQPLETLIRGNVKEFSLSQSDDDGKEGNAALGFVVSRPYDIEQLVKNIENKLCDAAMAENC